MKKTFLFFAALLTATVMNLQAATPNYLRFTSLKDGGSVQLDKVAQMSFTVGWLSATFEYSRDGVNWLNYTWDSYDSGKAAGYAISLNKGETVFFRAQDNVNTSMSNDESNRFQFTFGTNDSIAAGGNIMSLYDASMEQTNLTTGGFVGLFQNAKQLVSAPELPATTLATYCYKNMFNGCSSLVTAPELKATALANNCYQAMFQNCSKLEVNTFSESCDGAELVVPSSGANNWNNNMFTGCKGTAVGNIQLGGHYCIREFGKSQEPIEYIAPVYNTAGDPKSGILRWDTLSCTNYTVVEDASTRVTWNAGWYVVKGTNVILEGGAACNGAVNLILADYATMSTENDSDAGIQVTEGSSLTIYGQANQTGRLFTYGNEYAAGIGGNNGVSGSNITINGGTVIATGGECGAGIGGGNEGSGSNITINGGTVNATGNGNAAGIGGGKEGAGSNITINGGKVTAMGDQSGIGGGYHGAGSNITINGGEVTAKSEGSGAGIGGGERGSGSNITINGGAVIATGGNDAAGIGGGSTQGTGSYITIKGGIVTATGGENGAGIGSGTDGDAASNIFVNPALLLKADGTNPPTTVIAPTRTISDDIAGDLAGKRYATVEPMPEPDMHDFLYFVGLNGNDTVRMRRVNTKQLTATFQYSNDRINWSDYTWPDNNGNVGAAIELKNAGDTVFFRAKGTDGKNGVMSISDTYYFSFFFGADDQIAAGGNIMSLYDATCEQDTMTAYGFYSLFKDAKQLVSSPKLPATKLANYCYMNMFKGCTALTQVPELKATTLASNCCSSMFQNCTSLIQAPELNATTLATNCYSSMFTGCSSLTQAPELKATTLASNCYMNMFKGCTALTQAPELKATAVANNCYSSMFQNCTSLIQAPELNATTLANYCYMNMFKGCTSLEVDTISGSCDGAELTVPSVSGTAPNNWNTNMFAGCKGDAKYTAQTGIKLGGHYCIKEYVAVITGVTLTGYNAAYDGENHSVQVSGTIAGDVIEFSGDSATWQSTNPSFKSVVDTLIYVRVQRASYQDWGGKATIKITARAITMTSASDSKQFDGDPLTNATITFSGDGFVGQDTVSCTVTGSQTAVGSSPNYFSYTFSGSSEDNYAFTKVEGTLEVTAAPVAETYGRKVTNGNYGTICLAKKFNATEGVAALYVPATKDANYLYCEEVAIKDVVAGGAYIFKSNADSVTFTLEGEAVVYPVNNDHMIGWLEADKTLAEESDYYGLNGNTLIKLAAGSTIKQNRAVIDLDNVSTGTPAPGRKYVSFGINTPTGLMQNAECTMQSGKMIINGQLIIIRDGKKYNAQGQQL